MVYFVNNMVERSILSTSMIFGELAFQGNAKTEIDVKKE